ncbi:hypothetical protein ACN263_20550 [Micromonospora sp. WMMD729]|uniref:hypothetical protein n=1 Tax=Micromonospora sp. WMMD729 TaxID=3404127 RepID=UPI003BF57720
MSRAVNGEPPGPCDGQQATRVRHDDAVDDLRDAWLATIAAADRAGAQLHGAGAPGRRLPWQEAVTECWRALGDVYAGLAADRASATTATAGELIAGLRAARADADRAATLAARARWRLAAAEDRLRRSHVGTVEDRLRDSPDGTAEDPPRSRHTVYAEDRLRRTPSAADVVAARRFAAAITRLDLVVTRLAVGGRRIDRSVAALTGVGADPAPSVPRSTASTSELAQGCRVAMSLAARRRPATMSRRRRW